MVGIGVPAERIGRRAEAPIFAVEGPELPVVKGNHVFVVIPFTLFACLPLKTQTSQRVFYRFLYVAREDCHFRYQQDRSDGDVVCQWAH